MSLPVPENDAVKKAVKWIADEMRSDDSLKRSELVHKAAVRYDLSPAETEYLFRAKTVKDV